MTENAVSNCINLFYMFTIVKNHMCFGNKVFHKV